jgi:hypothetical protein
VLAVTHDEQFVAALVDDEVRLLSPLEAGGPSRVEHRAVDRAGRS